MEDETGTFDPEREQLTMPLHDDEGAVAAADDNDDDEMDVVDGNASVSSSTSSAAAAAAAAAAEEEEDNLDSDAEGSVDSNKSSSSIMMTAPPPGTLDSAAEEEEEGDDDDNKHTHTDTQTDADLLLTQKKLVPAKSAWMLYSMQERQVLKTKQPSLKVTEQIKIMSASWKALSDEARQPFLDAAAADKARYQAEKALLKEAQARVAAKNKQLGGQSQGGGVVVPGPRELRSEMIFPLARIRRTMKLDPEVKNVTKDATLLMAKATELFLDLLGEEAAKASGRRKTLKGEDVAAGMRRRGNLAFLRPDFPLEVGNKKKTTAGPQMNAVAKLAAADQRKKRNKQAAAGATQGEGEGQASGSEAESPVKSQGKKRGRKPGVAAANSPVVVKGGGIGAYFGKKKVEEEEEESA